jgi:hypothetical protein
MLKTIGYWNKLKDFAIKHKVFTIFFIFFIYVYWEKYSYYEATRIRDSIEIASLSKNIHLQFAECRENEIEVHECIDRVNHYLSLTKPYGIVKIYSAEQETLLIYENTKSSHKDRKLVTIPKIYQHVPYHDMTIIVQKHSTPNIFGASIRAITLSAFDIIEKLNSIGFEKTVDWYFHGKIYLRSQIEFAFYSFLILYYISWLLVNRNLKFLNLNRPSTLVKLLTNFTIDKPIKYTTHSWDFGELKKEYGNFDGYMSAVKKQFDGMKDELQKLSPNLYQKIYTFLIEENPDTDYSWCQKANINLGWSSLKGLREWCDSGKNPFDFSLKQQIVLPPRKQISTFGEVINLFKQEIEVRAEFKNLEAMIQSHNVSMDLSGAKLANRQFYTDTQKLSFVITKIFNEIKKRDEHDKIEVITTELEDRSIELKITQIGSYANKNGQDLLKEANDGDFADIKDSLKNLCDWSVESSFEEENFRVNYLYSNNVKEIEAPDTKPKGFTHILRFYK